MEQQTLPTPHQSLTPAPLPLGPRLLGLAILCIALFGLATLVGLATNLAG